VKYAEVTRATASAIEHHDMASMSSLFRRAAKTGLLRDWEPATQAYEELCRLVLGFLTEALPATASSQKPEALASGRYVAVSRQKAMPVPPSPADFEEALAKDGFPRAAELLRHTRTEHPDALPPFEDVVNLAAYDLLGVGRGKEALPLFALNVELFPDSANASDSLGEAYLGMGNLDLSERCYQDALRKLESAQGMSASRKERQAASIKRALEEIRKRREK
jgi:tetratricopeptide (TPR) repeat protein